eukprot:5671486-Karenia_brevis.AAC.1
MWQTFRKFTRTQHKKITCTPDEQWAHWSSQGDVCESVWDSDLLSSCSEWVNLLRMQEPVHSSFQPVSDIEMHAACNRLRAGKSPGND